jgi:hypothetical protein
MPKTEAAPLVLIEWEDSAQPLAAWRYLDDLPVEIVKCQSVGFLVYDGAKVKALAPNVGDWGGEHAQASGLMRIPARCITKISRLRIAR